MAVEPQGRAGWWLASDGKMYPPESHPSAPPPEDATGAGDTTGTDPIPPGGWGAPTPPAPQPASSWAPPPGPARQHVGQPLQAPPYYGPSAYQQTPTLNRPGGGPWAPPQQIGFPSPSKSPGLAVASLILGVGSVLFSLIPFFGFTSVPFAMCGLALGIAGFVRAQKGEEGKGLSIAGMATSAAALLVSAIYLVVLVVAADEASDEINSDPANGFCDTDRFFQDPDC